MTTDSGVNGCYLCAKPCTFELPLDEQRRPRKRKEPRICDDCKALLNGDLWRIGR